MIRRAFIIFRVALAYLALALIVFVIPNVPEFDETRERLADAIETFGDAVGRIGDRSHSFGGRA